MDYVLSDEKGKSEILNNIITFDNLNDKNKVVCKGWSELYKELLIDAGFNEQNIKIQQNGVHRWIEVDLQNGNILLADATDAIDKSIDLAASKAGYSTNGFMVLDASFSGYSPKQIFNLQKDQTHGSYYKQIIDSNNEWVKSLDSYLGYASEAGYPFEQLIKTNEMFSNSKLLNELLSNNSVNKKIEGIFNIDIPKEMDGYEAWAYFRKISKNILGENSNKLLNIFLYNETPKGIEPIDVLSYIDENGINHYQIYSETMGKIHLNGLEEYNNFKKGLNLVEK